MGVRISDAAVDRLQADGLSAVVTMGAAGCLVVEGSRQTAIAGRTLARPVDTTGAGDKFAGVLAAWLAGGSSLLEAARAASVAAALSIGKVGARSGMPRRDAIVEAMAAWR
jgi:ribokinase